MCFCILCAIPGFVCKVLKKRANDLKMCVFAVEKNCNALITASCHVAKLLSVSRKPKRTIKIKCFLICTIVLLLVPYIMVIL